MFPTAIFRCRGEAATWCPFYDLTIRHPKLEAKHLIHQTAGARTRGVEERGDVLIFTTAPFSHDLTVAGAAKATLIVRSDALATDLSLGSAMFAPGRAGPRTLLRGTTCAHFKSEANQCDCVMTAIVIVRMTAIAAAFTRSRCFCRRF